MEIRSRRRGGFRGDVERAGRRAGVAPREQQPRGERGDTGSGESDRQPAKTTGTLAAAGLFDNALPRLRSGRGWPWPVGQQRHERGAETVALR